MHLSENAPSPFKRNPSHKINLVRKINNLNHLCATLLDRKSCWPFPVFCSNRFNYKIKFQVCSKITPFPCCCFFIDCQSRLISSIIHGFATDYVDLQRIHKIQLQIIDIFCFVCSNLWLHLFDHRGCLFVILYVGAISLVTFSSGVFSRVPFDWVPFRSVRFHRHSLCRTFDGNFSWTNARTFVQTSLVK